MHSGRYVLGFIPKLKREWVYSNYLWMNQYFSLLEMVNINNYIIRCCCASKFDTKSLHYKKFCLIHVNLSEEFNIPLTCVCLCSLWNFISINKFVYWTTFSSQHFVWLVLNLTPVDRKESSNWDFKLLGNIESKLQVKWPQDLINPFLKRNFFSLRYIISITWLYEFLHRNSR